MGTNIIITKANGNCVPLQNRRTATGITNAKQNWALNAEDTVNITVESPFPQEYTIGDRITIFGRDYKLNRLPSVKKTGMHQFQYDLQFEGVQYDLFRVSYDLTIDTTTNQLQDIQGDTLTGDLRRFMTVLVANANRVFPGKWALGVCPDTIGDKTLTFGESDNCLSVLQNLCGDSNFNVEFDIVKLGDVYTINLYDKVGQTLPYRFEYGKGRGLYDLHRENVSSANIVTRLKVYGSTENITSKYRADRLCLPGRTKGQSYIEKAEMVAKYGVFEGRKNFDDVKPTFTGSVETKVDEFSFIDTKFPFDLNAKNAQGETLYLMNGVAAKIHFNTGNLAGYDFEVKSYDHATHKFTLIKTTDDRGDVFPSETSLAFQFAEGNEYKVLDIAYSQDIEAAAEAELEEVGNKYYDQNCQPKVQYGLSVTKAYLEKLVGTDDAIVNVFAPGDYLHVVDADIDVDKAIRIKSFVRNVLDPYEYTLTISDTTTSATITNRVISDLVELDKIIAINNLKDPTRARANWRSSREVLNMVFDPEGDYYTDKIKPYSIDTLALAVGAKSMQFGLTNTVFQPNYEGKANAVRWQGGVLTHYTISEETAVSWVMADGTTSLSKDSSAYYLYAKCAKAGTAGSFIFTTSQIKVDEDVNYYHFLVGTLSSIDPELKVRSLALTYGFTMVNGRFIKTGRIESADGTTYFDLDNSEIGGRIVFNSNGEEKTLEQLGAEALESKDFINNTLPGLLSEIQAQLDGQIEQFFETYDPTMSNAPAKDWTTTELKEKHLGDLFYNTDTGAVYCFVKENGTYKWQQLSDNEVANALVLANEALALAKDKNRIFTSTPYTPYDVGDLWVNGSILRRCATAKTETQSYNVNDWVVAVDYDNTKTVIDGGLVTSGTLQVAGDNKSILAGITGQGTAASSVRFWAGASFKNRATAPFRVLQDGSVVMTKADIKGVINAVSGLIGGFEIAPGRIGVAETIGGSSNDGLTILKSFIKYSENTSDRSIWSGIGTNVFPSYFGFPCLARFEYTDSYSYGRSAISLYAKCRPNYKDPRRIQRAVDYDGNMFGIGGVAQFQDIYVGPAYTDTIQEYFMQSTVFVFNAIGVSNLKVDLPTPTQIKSALGRNDVTFELQIVVAHNSTNKITVCGASTNPLLGNNCQYINGDYGKLGMTRGDAMILRYSQNHYYLVQYKT